MQQFPSGGNMASMATRSLVPSGSRILIASADPIFRSRMLKNREYAGSLSEEAEGGAHALSKLLHFPCDSVLLDRNLPDLDATEVAELIRQRYPQTEVEFFDSRSGESVLESGQDRRAWEMTEQNEESKEGDSHSAVAAPMISLGHEPLPGMIGTGRAIPTSLPACSHGSAA